MGKTIAVCNQKGGVGKTTTTLNLGVGLVRQGKRVLLVDADPQSDLTSSLGWNGDSLEKSLGRLMYLATQEYKPAVKDTIIHHPEGVDLIPSNLDLSSMETQLVNAMSREKILANLLKEVKKDYDYILIDCMPSLGMITINALTAADSVIIPVQAQFLPAKGMTQLMKSIDMVRNHTNDKLKICGIVMTLVDGRTNLAKEVIDTIRTKYGMQIRIFDTQIPVAVKAAEASKAGQSIYEYDHDSKPARLTNMMAILKAKKKPLTVFSAADLPDLDEQYIGLSGSPTQNGELHMVESTKSCTMLEGTEEETAAMIYDRIKQFVRE